MDSPDSGVKGTASQCLARRVLGLQARYEMHRIEEGASRSLRKSREVVGLSASGSGEESGSDMGAWISEATATCLEPYLHTKVQSAHERGRGGRRGTQRPEED